MRYFDKYSRTNEFSVRCHWLVESFLLSGDPETLTVLSKKNRKIELARFSDGVTDAVLLHKFLEIESRSVVVHSVWGCVNQRFDTSKPTPLAKGVAVAYTALREDICRRLEKNGIPTVSRRGEIMISNRATLSNLNCTSYFSTKSARDDVEELLKPVPVAQYGQAVALGLTALAGAFDTYRRARRVTNSTMLLPLLLKDPRLITALHSGLPYEDPPDAKMREFMDDLELLPDNPLGQWDEDAGR